jgi:hypothetical protein
MEKVQKNSVSSVQRENSVNPRKKLTGECRKSQNDEFIICIFVSHSVVRVINQGRCGGEHEWVI